MWLLTFFVIGIAVCAVCAYVAWGVDDVRGRIW